MRLVAFLSVVVLASWSSADGGSGFGVWEKQIAPGLTYRMEVAEGPRLIHALRFTPGAPELRLSPELAGGTINEGGTVKGRLVPGKIVEQTKALAAINADFFSFEHGAPIGLMVRNGEIVTSPAKARSVFGWGQEFAFGLPSFKGTLSDTDGLSMAIESVNQPTGQNQVAIYTSSVGFIEPAGDNLMALIKVDRPLIHPDDVVNGTVEYLIADSKKMSVPEGKVLIVARGNKAPILAGLRPDHKVRIAVETRGFDWTKVENAIGGGPMLVSGGRILENPEGFAASFTDGRHPRSAVGRTKEGDIWLMAVDGRQGMSIGASLKETAKIMMDLGCVDAMNLDGGGSTNLHILGVTVNRPSDKIERPVSNALVIFGPQAAVSKGKMEIKAPATMKPADTAEVKLLMDGKEVPQSEVIWSMQGAGWIDQGGLVRAVEKGKGSIRAYCRGIVAATEVVVTDDPPPAIPKVMEVAKAEPMLKKPMLKRRTIRKRTPTLKVSITSTRRPEVEKSRGNR